MTSYTHVSDAWYFIYDVTTKSVIIHPRLCVNGAVTSYDETKVAIVTATSKEAIDAILDAKSY